MARAAQRRGTRSTEQETGGPEETARSDEAAANAVIEAQAKMFRSATAFGDEMAGFAGEQLRRSQEALQSILSSGNPIEACGRQWDYTVSTGRQCLDETRKLADLGLRLTQDGWDVLRAAGRLPGAGLQSTAETAEQAVAWTRANWDALEDQVKERWNRLTDEDLAAVEGSRERLVGRLQRRYDVAREEAERQVRAFERRVS